jgi:hypothetical protein
VTPDAESRSCESSELELEVVTRKEGRGRQEWKGGILREGMKEGNEGKGNLSVESIPRSFFLCEVHYFKLNK